ncbi:SH3 domain-containing protein [Streptomyces sp. IBSBF 3136]|uniref:SH3 domain-containing protein n=1 Tax=Streptomyces sp. IBSBF 3136 TaxID=2903524 RepID=UPI002FDBEFF3
MIRRTLKSGLLATVAVLAFLPTAGAAPASAATAPRPAPTTAQYPGHHARHRVHRSHRRTYPALGRVATRHARLNVRSGPGTGYRVVGHRHMNRLLAVVCETYGTGVRGNHLWYRLPHHRGYVTARYVVTNRAVPWC